MSSSLSVLTLSQYVETVFCHPQFRLPSRRFTQNGHRYFLLGIQITLQALKCVKYKHKINSEIQLEHLPILAQLTEANCNWLAMYLGRKIIRDAENTLSSDIKFPTWKKNGLNIYKILKCYGIKF